MKKKKTKSTIFDSDKYAINILYNIITLESSMFFYVTCDHVIVVTIIYDIIL